MPKYSIKTIVLLLCSKTLALQGYENQMTCVVIRQFFTLTENHR